MLEQGLQPLALDPQRIKIARENAQLSLATDAQPTQLLTIAELEKAVEIGVFSRLHNTLVAHGGDGLG